MGLRIFTLLLLTNSCIVLTCHAGTNDLIFKSSFEPLFFVGGETTTANVVVKLNQFDEYTIPSIGAYVIPYPIENGASYSVVVIIPPNGSLCSVQNNNGIIADNDVIDADIFCGVNSSIYEVKQELITGLVAIVNVIVTECKESDGYWVQTIAGDVNYTGNDYSGSYVNKNDIVCVGDNADVKVGDRVTLNPAFANNFFGQVQMVHNSLTVLSSNNTLPEPVVTSVASLSGLSAVPLEGVLVKVENLIVTHVQIFPGTSEPAPANNFVVNDLLIIDDVIYLTQPFPEIDDDYDSITGISIFRHDQSKLLPRYSQDLIRALGSGTDLVINEVDYDQPATDTHEFIEIYNPTNSVISLSNISLYMINGSNNLDYAQIDLTSLESILPGQYLVIGSSNMLDDVAAGALTLEFEGPENQIQNSNPEGLVLFNKNSNTVIDSLSYGGDLLTATLTDINMQVNVAEGTGSVPDSNEIDGSIARFPSGEDTNDNSQDWDFTASTSPGAFNTFTTTPELLVINEIDYNQPSKDDEEFIEIYNPSMSNISLANVSVYLINGTDNTDYLKIELDSLGTIDAGQYLVIGSSNMINSVAQGALRLQFDSPENQMRNSGPDGVVLFNNNNNTVIDSMSYVGNITTATLSDVGIEITVTEGSSSLIDDNIIDGSLSRIPNGDDTDNNNNDFEFTTTLSPGEANSASD